MFSIKIQSIPRTEVQIVTGRKRGEMVKLSYNLPKTRHCAWGIKKEVWNTIIQKRTKVMVRNKINPVPLDTYVNDEPIKRVLRFTYFESE